MGKHSDIPDWSEADAEMAELERYAAPFLRMGAFLFVVLFIALIAGVLVAVGLRS